MDASRGPGQAGHKMCTYLVSDVLVTSRLRLFKGALCEVGVSLINP